MTEGQASPAGGSAEPNPFDVTDSLRDGSRRINRNHVTETNRPDPLAALVDDLDPVVERQMAVAHLGTGHLARAGEGPDLGGGEVGTLAPFLVDRDHVVVEIEIIPTHQAPNEGVGFGLRLLI